MCWADNTQGSGAFRQRETNPARRAEFTRRTRQQALANLLDRLADERGSLDTPEDETEMARYMRLRGAMADESGGLQVG
jgi:hypothetical protein